ncbi:hypothetical protein [Mycobacteroides salmoniphilum]|nr:hypothetical protein [Mycobacteroides salmoniphilum]
MADGALEFGEELEGRQQVRRECSTGVTADPASALPRPTGGAPLGAD